MVATAAEDRHASMPELVKPLEQRAHPESGDAAKVPSQSKRAGWIARLEAFVSGWRDRRARNELLLDLGAIVFELHRQGRREPELLRAKAAAIDEHELQRRSQQQEVGGTRPCRECGEQVAPDQLVCVRCGERVALAEPRSDRLPLLGLVTLGVVVGLVCFGFALSELTDEQAPGIAEDEPVLQATSVPDRDATRGGQGRGVAAEDRRAAVAGYRASGGGSAAGRGAAVAGGGQPQKASAYTVVLVTSSDRVGARRVAQDAARSGLKVGLLRSDEYNLGEGLWIVAAGRHDSRAQAARRAARLASRYPGAYPQLLKAGG
jgi:hypothetical protein